MKMMNRSLTLILATATFLQPVSSFANTEEAMKLINQEQPYLKLTNLDGHKVYMEKCEKNSCKPLLPNAKSCFEFNPKSEAESQLRSLGTAETIVEAAIFFPLAFFGSRQGHLAKIMKQVRQILESQPNNKEILIGLGFGPKDPEKPASSSNPIGPNDDMVIVGVSRDANEANVVNQGIIIFTPSDRGFNEDKEVKYIRAFREIFQPMQVANPDQEKAKTVPTITIQADTSCAQ